MPNILKKLNSFTAMRVKYGSYAVIASAALPINVDYLVVGGGGGGGNGWGAGAGGGGVVQSTGLSITSGLVVTITVGAGGPAVTAGFASVFSSITGGYGGYGPSFVNPQSTGDNGGAGGATNGSGGGAASGISNSGAGGVGNGTGGTGGTAKSTVTRRSGGGGGASTNGVDGNSVPDGGAGIAGATFGGTYGGGGGGGTADNTIAAGAGGTGGGGAGNNIGGGNGTAGTQNTGGGGGGSGNPGTGGAGGSGIVIIRYADSNAALTGGSGLTGFSTPVVSGGYRTYTITAGTGTVTFP